MDQRVSFITLGVADLACSQAFYERLGWKASSYGAGAGVAFFALAGGLVLALYPREELARDAGIENAGPPTSSGVSLSYNTRSIEEAEQLMAEAERVGAKVLKAVAPVFWGGHVGYFADPDGHLWEVAYNPKAEIAADGTISIPA